MTFLSKIKASLSIAFIICSCALVSMCSKNESAAKSDLLSHAAGIARLKQGDEMSEFYSRATVRAAEKYSSKNSGTDILSGLDRKIFIKGSVFDIISEKRENTRAEITLRITKHPSPNMTGYEARLEMLFEDDVWKIDRQKQIESLL